MMMNNDDVVGDSMENNVGGGREDRTCTFSKRGICEQHLVAGTKLSIPAKKWKDRGRGKGFGWVTTRTTRYLCKVRKSGPTVLDNSSDVEGLRSQKLRGNYTYSGDYNLGTEHSAGDEIESSDKNQIKESG